MAEAPGTQREEIAERQHQEARVRGHSGQYGVSDDRRAELSRLEQEAGVEHGAPDQTVTERPEQSSARDARLAADQALERPGDRH